jgi:hypothetical protein
LKKRTGLVNGLKQAYKLDYRIKYRIYKYSHLHKEDITETITLVSKNKVYEQL